MSWKRLSWSQYGIIAIIVATAVMFCGTSSMNGRGLLESLSEGNGPHKDLFPLDSSDIWGTILVGLGLMIAASGGIGGGGILVPLFILIFDFHPKYAIPLSNFTIVGSSITNMIMNLSKRHPDANRPLVDWDLILVMEPMTMVGAILGAMASKLLPDWFLVISLVALLAYTTKTTLEKGFQQFTKETKQFEEEKQSELSKSHKEISLRDMSETKSLLDDDDDEIDEEKPSSQPHKKEDTLLSHYKNGEFHMKEVKDPELQTLLESESKTPKDLASLMTFMVIFVVFVNLLKGGGSFQSPIGIDCGSFGYWFLTLLAIGFVLAVSFWTRGELIKKWMLKTRLNYRYVKGDVEWNQKNTIIYPSICFFAGFSAGLFGIGGGIVKGPLMLYMGVNPLVASATVAVMIMFTSVAGTAMFITFGTLKWDYAIFFFIIGLVTTAVGQFGVSYLVNKYRRVSLVSLSIGAVVAISTVLMGIQSIFSLIQAEEGEGDSSSLCGK